MKLFTFCIVGLSLILGLVVTYVAAVPVEGPGRLDDLPYIEMFQPEKKQNVPIRPGEYRESFLLT